MRILKAASSKTFLVGYDTLLPLMLELESLSSKFQKDCNHPSVYGIGSLGFKVLLVRLLKTRPSEENRTNIHVQLTLRLHLEWPWSCKADGMLIWLDCWSNASEAPITPTFGKLWGGHDRSKKEDWASTHASNT